MTNVGLFNLKPYTFSFILPILDLESSILTGGGAEQAPLARTNDFDSQNLPSVVSAIARMKLFSLTLTLMYNSALPANEVKLKVATCISGFLSM